MCFSRRHKHHVTAQQVEEIIMSATQDAVDQIVTQLSKAKAEIVSKIDDLQAAVDAGEAPDLAPLKAVVQSLDDVVPDAPVDEPPTEPPVDEPPADQ